MTSTETAWLKVFDKEDLITFIGELLAAGSFSARVECVSAWRTTARQLEDPLRRSVLLEEKL